MNTRGFTVMEILVALFIFSIVVLPLAELLSADSKFGKKYEQKQVAMLVAKNELEKAKHSLNKPIEETYEVTMAGKRWSVTIAVEEKELALLPGQKSLQTPPAAGIGGPGEALPLPKPVPVAKQFITVRVSRPYDSGALAEFRVMKETYR